MKFILFFSIAIAFSFIPYVESDADSFKNSITETYRLKNQSTQSVEFSCKNCHTQDFFFKKESFSLCKTAYTFVSDNSSTHTLVMN